MGQLGSGPRLVSRIGSAVGLPDLRYFPGALVFRPLSPISRTEAKSPVFDAA